MSRRYELGKSDSDRVFIGEDVTIRCQMVVRNVATGIDAVEGDVSGNDYRMEIKKNAKDATALIDVDKTGGEITFGAGDTTLGELAGDNTVLLIALSDTETEKILSEGLYHFDLWRIDAGSEAVVAFGTIFFTDSIRLAPSG